jgi:selenocysteine lyase/cysteine desulfurase
LFAFPAQSNFSGVQHPLAWIARAKDAGYDVLLDAAAFAPTNRLDLSRWHPDYVSLSFYKIFGYPTGIGALLVRRPALAKLRRPWYSGGTITFSSVRSQAAPGAGFYLTPGPAGFEDGTVDYLGIPAVGIGLDHISSVGIETIHTRVMCLTGWLLDALAALRHGNGAPVVRLYGPAGTDRRGATIAMNFFDPAGVLIDSFRVERPQQPGLLTPADTVVTTVAEHHANLLPWSRAATCRYIECGQDGTFSIGDATAALDRRPAPALLAITGGSNVTGWMPPLGPIIAAAHDRGIPVVVDAAQLAPHRPLPAEADFLTWSGHKMYAPFGAGVLVGPGSALADGDPFLAGGGAVDLVDLDEVNWAGPPDREEAGSADVIGAVALHAAIDALTGIGWPALIGHERRITRLLREGLASIPGVRLLGPDPEVETLPVATFTVEGVPHALVAAAGRRGGDRCAAWLLLRASLPDAAPRPDPPAGSPLRG